MITVVLSVLAIVLSLLSFYWSRKATRLMEKAERESREMLRTR